VSGVYVLRQCGGGCDFETFSGSVSVSGRGKCHLFLHYVGWRVKVSAKRILEMGFRKSNSEIRLRCSKSVLESILRILFDFPKGLVWRFGYRKQFSYNIYRKPFPE